MAIQKMAPAALVTVTVALLVGAAGASAQGAGANGRAAADESQLTEVTVTGSRVRRDVFDAPSPIQIITRDESTLAGLVSTTDILQGTGVTGGQAQINNSFGGFVTDGGPGANTLGLRGLGAGRTLILLNGRRLAPAGTRGAVGTVDLNVLPNAMTERIEVLRDGASSVYGSDAIAGVINVITEPKITGLTFEGQFNSPVDGGGDRTRISLVGGWSNDRMHVSVSGDYFKRNTLTLADRDWTRCNTDYVFTADFSRRVDFIDPATSQPKCYPISGTGSNGVTINTIGTQTLAGARAVGAVGTTFNRWRPNAAVTTGLVGYEGVGGGANGLNVRDTFDPRTLNRTLISPAEVATVYAEGSFNLEALGNAEIYADLLLNNRSSEQVGYRQLSLDYPLGSPLLPANLAGSNFSAATVLTGARRVGVRAFIGFGNDESSQDVDYLKGNVGLKGDLFIEGWRYDAYLSIAKSDASYTFDSWLTDKLARSVDVVAAPAGFNAALVRNGLTCAANIANPSLGCIPAPALTPAVVGGSLPQDWIDSTFVPVTGKTIYEESVAALSFDGGLFDLPAGEVGAALGFEYRRARINDTPASDSQGNNLYNFTSSALTRGKDSVQEVYAEVEVPLLRGMPFAKDLTLNLSGRYTDYDSYGGDETYKVGLSYTPIDAVSLRGTYGTSFRAPALFEQFQGASTGFLSSQTDPCNTPTAGTVRARNCLSEGLQPTFLATNGVTVFTQGGAAQGLTAETSENLTIGAVLKPPLPDGWGTLAFAIDYYDIRIEDGVDQVGSGNLISLCYDDPGFRGPNGRGYCSFISRDSLNRLFISNAYTNVSTQKVRGIDYNLRYTQNVGPGKLRLKLEVSTFDSQAVQLLPTSPIDETNGTIGAPDLTGEIEVMYTWGNWRVRASNEYVTGMDSTEYLDDAGSGFLWKVPGYNLVHASVEYSHDDKWSVTFGGRNLGDKDPPPISFGFYNRIGNAPLYSGYDFVGRQVFLNTSWKF